MDVGSVVVGVSVAMVSVASLITVILPVFLLVAAATTPPAVVPPPAHTVPAGALSALGRQAEPTADVIDKLRKLADNDPALHAVVEAHVRALSKALIAHQALHCHLSAQWKLNNNRHELDQMNQVSWDRVQIQVLALGDLHLCETRRLLEQDPGGTAALEARARRMARREMG